MRSVFLAFPNLLILVLLFTLSGLPDARAQDHTLQQSYGDAFWDKIELEIGSDPNATLKRANDLVKKFEFSGNQILQGKALIVAIRCLYYLEEREAMATYSEKGVALAKKLKSKVLESTFLVSLGLSKTVNQQYAESKRLILAGLLLAETENAAMAIGDALMALGHLSYELGDFDEALAVYIRANDIYEKEGSQFYQSEALASISLIYGALGKNEKSVEYQKKSLAMIDLEKNIMDASISLYNLGTTYRDMGDFENAEHYIRRALNKSRQADDIIGIAYAEYELSALLSEKGDTEAALVMLNKVIDIFKKNHLSNMVIISLLGRARHMAVLGQGALDSDFVEAKALIDKVKSERRYIDYYQTQAFVYEEENKLAQAVEALRKMQKKQGELHKKQLESKTNKLEAGFNLKQKEAEYALLQKDLALEKSLNKQQESQTIILMLVLGLVFTALASIVYLLRVQIKSKERFKNLAMYDDLTQAPNRRHIMEFARSKQDDYLLFSEPVVFAVLDIDWFKKINDRFGHDVGDTVLKEFARALQQALRHHDKFGRIGGEEWLLVQPSTMLSKVDMIFERVQEILKNTKFKGLPPDYPVTASMGAAQVSMDDKDINSVLKRADEKLYLAKQSGRNCLKV